MTQQQQQQQQQVQVPAAAARSSTRLSSTSMLRSSVTAFTLVGFSIWFLLAMDFRASPHPWLCRLFNVTHRTGLSEEPGTSGAHPLARLMPVNAVDRCTAVLRSRRSEFTPTPVQNPLS